MRFFSGLLLFAFAMVGISAWRHAGTAALHQNPSPAPVAVPATQTSNQEINDGFVKQIRERIAGHEKESAEQVFKNIQQLKGVPAARLLLIMNLGYSRALGVNCTHCHVERDFSSDDKRPKRAAREMAVMHRMINEQLKQMKNLEPKENRAINCSTCHRGAIDPMASQR
jgi:thymidylate synthase